MASIASRSEIIQIEPQVRPLLDGHLVVRMEVAFSPIVSGAKLREHCLHRWVTDVRFTEQLDYIRLPSAIYAAPAVTLKTEDSKSAMVRIVSAVTA